MKSRFGLERFGMAPSCHDFRFGGKPCGNHTDPLPKFDYISIGHWHVPAIIDGNILVNGNLPGTTEFDHIQGRHAAPSQQWKCGFSALQ
jgi:hypothetical protein